ncbi:MAG: aminoglycoside phosphotransferase [Frankiales bacterium]|nr:aminoglycoside phosphotransferase [Frankiales bacterium]
MGAGAAAGVIRLCDVAPVTQDTAAPQDTAATEEDRAAAFVQQLTGGRVVKIRRLARWRPAWFMDVQVGPDGTPPLKLHLRGDRRSDVLPFPELQREAGILQVLEANGLPVPHVYGMCPDPEAIVMTAVPGIRDVTRLEPARRVAIAEEYMTLLARMHQLDIAPFVALGIDEPTTPEQIGLGMLDAYLPLYERTKAKPEPLIEFALAWARRNVPRHRTKPAFVHWDAGQFLHDGERITALYDFETCLIGDPLMDLAALRMRDPAEPIGADLPHLFRHYAEATGEPVDLPVLRYHTVIFALVGVMALAGPMVAPQTGSPHLEYLWWDLMQRRTLVWALAECLGLEVERPAPPAPAESPRAAMHVMLQDSLAQLTPGSGIDRYTQAAVATLARCLAHADAVGPELERQDIAEIGSLLGSSFDDRASADRALEEFVLTAGPESDAALAQCFARQVERMVHLLEPVADRVAGYDLAPATT